mmetsp:Transcript_91300/g.133477  ORF Transcript_91300/g.133477 Transcript_91300/m.133477 type:complete len:84 (-) Transcript_91300:67-318(-)
MSKRNQIDTCGRAQICYISTAPQLGPGAWPYCAECVRVVSDVSTGCTSSRDCGAFEHMLCRRLHTSSSTRHTYMHMYTTPLCL